MPQLAVRISNSTLARLDAACAERGQTRSQLVRQLIFAAVEGASVATPDTPSEDELIELLSERARAGNVGAIRSLLARTDVQEALRALAEERQS